MNALTERQRGTCPFTGKPYDCHVCETHKTIEFVKTGRIHMTLSVDGPLHRNFVGEWRKLAKFYKDFAQLMTWQMVRDSFRMLSVLGVDTIPMCDCKKFCFKKGCIEAQEKPHA